MKPKRMDRRTYERMAKADYGAAFIAAMNVMFRKFPDCEGLSTVETDDGLGFEIEADVGEALFRVGEKESFPFPPMSRGRFRCEMSFPSATRVVLRVEPERLQ